MLIEIDDRLYDDFLNWANVNNMPQEDIDKYIQRAFRDKFMTDKYGDLNQKISNKPAIVSDMGPKDEPIKEPVIEVKKEETQEVPKRPKQIVIKSR